MNNLLKNINVRYCLYLIRLKEEMIYMNKYVYSLEHKKKINKKIYDIKRREYKKMGELISDNQNNKNTNICKIAKNV